MKTKYNLKEYINCTNCGSKAVTNNGKTCSSCRTGKICGGKIIKVKGLLVPKQGLWRLKTKNKQ